MGSSVLITPPTSEPITLAEAKAQCRVLHDHEDTYLTGLIALARQYAEEVLGYGMLTQTWDYYLDSFAAKVIRLPKGPVVSVSSVSYADLNGSTQTLASSVYLLSAGKAPAEITLKSGQAWPSVFTQADSVVIRYVVGHATAAAIPAALKHAMLMLIAHWYEQRAETTQLSNVAQVPVAFDSLTANYRMRWL